MTYLHLALKILLIMIIAFVFFRLRQVINAEPLLQLKNRLYNTHVSILSLYWLGWALYESSYTLFEWDEHYVPGKADTKLILLAVFTILYNTCSVFLGLLLFYMVDKMTQPVADEYYDPVMKRHVPFFVYLANCKLAIEFTNKGGRLDQEEHRAERQE